MENELGVLDRMRLRLTLEINEGSKRLNEMAALVGAQFLLAEAEEKITDPIEQIKYLFHRVSKMPEKFFMHWIPWAWLKHCVSEKLITKLPTEEWAITVCLVGSALEEKPELILEYIDMEKIKSGKDSEKYTRAYSRVFEEIMSKSKAHKKIA